MKPLGVMIKEGLKQVAPFAGARVETKGYAVLDSHIGAVAPFAGARVETPEVSYICYSSSVAPFTGARVETSRRNDKRGIKTVAPFTGARVETWQNAYQRISALCRSLHGSAS